MTADRRQYTRLSMSLRRLTVFFPDTSLDDLAASLEDREVDSLLTAWTAAWHPALLAGCEAIPERARLSAGPAAGTVVAILPAAWGDVFAGPPDGGASPEIIRGLESADAITMAAYRRLADMESEQPTAVESLPGAGHAGDFQALGLAVLLADLMARRMRSEADLVGTGFAAAVRAAARGAVAGDDQQVRERLREAFACLEATRARYYPVESWAIDAVLLGPTVGGAAASRDLDGPVPLAVVATGDVLRHLATVEPALIATLRQAVADGRIEPCGGRADDEPLDRLSLESIRDSFSRGRAAWREFVGREPVCQAAIAGGSSAVLPQILAGFGSPSALFSLCDGSPLPDPGSGRILWEGPGGSGVEAAARIPLHAGSSRSVLAIPDALGDAMDHDHVAVIQFASYAGSASPWHRLVRRIGHWSTLLGSFVTPSGFMAETAGSSTTVRFEPDAFPAAVSTARKDQAAVIAATRAEASRLAEAAESCRGFLPTAGQPRGTRPSGRGSRPGLLARWLGSRERDSMPLDNGLVRVELHPRTGGLLSLRRPEDRGNRVSQQLSLRTTSPPRPGSHETADERAVFTRMEADAIEREGDAVSGRLVSRGRLAAETGNAEGEFVQRVSLVPGLPLAVIEWEVRLERPLTGPLFEEHLCCRFAWHENEAVELRRSLHLQAVSTERTRFPAAHFIEIAAEGPRQPEDPVVLLTGGLPWHHRTSPHVLDSILLDGGDTVLSGRLAVGVGLGRPWEAAIAFAAGGVPEPGPSLPPNVRLTGLASAPTTGTVRQLVGLVESRGRGGEVRIEWARPVMSAVAVDLLGRPLPQVHVAVDGRTTVVFLDRYQWLHLELEFAAAAAGEEKPA